MSRERKDGVFHLRADTRHLNQGRNTSRTKRKVHLNLGSARKGTLEQLNNFFHAVKARIGIAGGTTQSNQEAHVPRNAIADCAKTREMNEEPLLKHRRERVIEVCSLGESPFSQ